MRAIVAVWRSVWDLTVEIVREWSRDRVGGLAAEISFWMVLSIFPALLVLVAALGWFDGIVGGDVAQRAENNVVEAIDDVLGSEGNAVSDAVAELFRSPNTGALTIGILLALFSASGGFSAVVRALDVAYDIETSRSWFHARATGLLLSLGTVLVAVVVLAMLLVGPLFGRGSDIASEIGLGGWFHTTWDVARLPVAFVVLVGWAATIYHVAVLHHTPWRWDLPGALLAGVFWVLSTFGFQLYLASAAGGSNAVLGTLGGALSLLLWAYLMSIGLVLGAELNQVLADRHEVRARGIRAGTLRGQVRSWSGRIPRRSPPSASPDQ